MSDEEKKAIKVLNNFNPVDSGREDTQAIETILNLIEKQSKEIEELKEQCKEVICVPEGTCFMIKSKDTDKKWEDKTKAKIEELEKDLKEYENGQEWEIQDEIRGQIEVLQSLLEKE